MCLWRGTIQPAPVSCLSISTRALASAPGWSAASGVELVGVHDAPVAH